MNAPVPSDALTRRSAASRKGAAVRRRMKAARQAPAQLSLIDEPTAYPDTPGFKAAGTSQEAAQSMQSRAATLRAEVYRVLLHSRVPLTADQIAYRLGENILSIRPRCSELVATGRIKDSGERGENVSGKSAVKWTVA